MTKTIDAAPRELREYKVQRGKKAAYTRMCYGTPCDIQVEEGNMHWVLFLAMLWTRKFYCRDFLNVFTPSLQCFPEVHEKTAVVITALMAILRGNTSITILHKDKVYLSPAIPAIERDKVEVVFVKQCAHYDSSQGFLYRTMPRFAPETPEPFTVICNDLKKKILPGMTHWQHPRFYAYYPAGRPYPDVLAELLTSAMAFNIFSWVISSPSNHNHYEGDCNTIGYESCPSLNELENTVVNWIGRAFGLPESFLFQVKDYQKSSGEAKFETAHDVGKKLVVYCSKDAHSCIEKACKVAMVRCRPIQPLAANKWGITGGQLEKCILKDIESGLIPTHIHVTLGTSATAADDHLESIWPVAKKYHMWIHCDASYSGNAWLDKKYRDNATAIEHVHSINVNLHKFLLFSGMTCLVWTRERNIYKEAFTTVSLQRRLMQGLYTTDIREWGIHRSRRNKALKIWMSLRLNGLQGLRYHLNNSVEMCAYFESLVATHPLLKIFSRKLALFTFYYEEPGSSKEENNTYTENLCQFINQSHRLYLTHTKVHDTDLIRVSVCYERTNKAVIDESWAILKTLIDEFTNRKSTSFSL
ncbi:unnamed protein product [Heligmosomoides polygyrus]|uniref:Aromatic-L-amino-acid decarboxylase n=1 Tax=Heligmosomoides polygyrus TaxID=6339 RepID=A0A3P8B411_HELPZ|nr:unnamed protein product [Heligmosomoides polygyrus]